MKEARPLYFAADKREHGAIRMQGVRYAVGVAAVYAFVMLLVCLVSGCGCICYDVVSPKNIGDIARSNITNMYGKYSVRVEDVPCRTNEDGVREAAIHCL